MFVTFVTTVVVQHHKGVRRKKMWFSYPKFGISDEVVVADHKTGFLRSSSDLNARKGKMILVEYSLGKDLGSKGLEDTQMYTVRKGVVKPTDYFSLEN